MNTIIGIIFVISLFFVICMGTYQTYKFFKEINKYKTQVSPNPNTEEVSLDELPA